MEKGGREEVGGSGREGEKKWRRERGRVEEKKWGREGGSGRDRQSREHGEIRNVGKKGSKVIFKKEDKVETSNSIKSFVINVIFNPPNQQNDSITE